MQTFLPYPEFRASAAALDPRRLGKQRVETLQILRALVWPEYGWKRHPAVAMWRGFTAALVCYGVAVCDQWAAYGCADTVRGQILEFTAGQVPHFDELRDNGYLPPWLGHEVLHLSHRSALLRKDPAYYRPRFGGLPDDLPYVWPRPIFPRWPVRRGHLDVLPLPAALALLGYAEAWPAQRAAVAAVAAGRDHVTEFPPGAGLTSTGLLAGLCTPGDTVWISSGPSLPDSPPAPPAAPVRGRQAPSIARPAGPRERAAMAAESAYPPEFRFLRPGQMAVLTHLLKDPTTRVGLVVWETNERPEALPRLPVPQLVLRRLQ